MVRVLVPLANGFEEIEAISVIDILRRAQLEVVVAGIESEQITGRNQITLLTDTTLEQLWPGESSDPTQPLIEQFDALVLPGGPGTKTLQNDPRIGRLIRGFFEQQRWVAAICAAPMALAHQGILVSKTVTGFFSPEAYRQAFEGITPLGLDVGPIAVYRTDAVVVDGKVITSRGAGTAVEFALQLVSEFVGPLQAEAIAQSIHSSWTPALAQTVQS